MVNTMDIDVTNDSSLEWIRRLKRRTQVHKKTHRVEKFDDESVKIVDCNKPEIGEMLETQQYLG